MVDARRKGGVKGETKTTFEWKELNLIKLEKRQKIHGTYSLPNKFDKIKNYISYIPRLILVDDSWILTYSMRRDKPVKHKRNMSIKSREYIMGTIGSLHV